jgi:hypothetical protein
MKEKAKQEISTMSAIEQKALETYQKNLSYFEKNHPKVHKEIVALDLVLSEGLYQERYSLEYKDEGYFDILELESQEFLYKANSLQAAKRMVDMVNHKRTGAVFKGLTFANTTEAKAEAIDKSELSFHNGLWATAKIINYVTAHASPATQMRRVHKIIFLGVGLGLHLLGIVEKLKPQVIFIKEKNLETFRLSLFVTDYEKLSLHGFLHFSLTDDEATERDNFLEFLNQGNNFNLHMKHIPFAHGYELELQRLQIHVMSQSYINYGYSAVLLRFIDSPRYLVQGYPYVNIAKPYYNFPNNILAQKPVLFVFSGPSSSNNIQWIKANRERFIVVSPLSACRLLNLHGMSPDVVLHIDPGVHSSTLFKDLNVKEFFKNTIAILSSNVDEATLQRFDRKNVYIVEQGSGYKRGFGNFSSPSVGEYTYGLFLILGATHIFMLGVDLALDSKTLQTHGSFHPYQKTAVANNKSASLDPKKSMMYVKGNFQDQVPTLPNFKTSIEQVEVFTDALKKEHHHVYNMSDGAYLKGCEPLHIEDFDWAKFEILDRTDVRDQMTGFFDTISSDDFNDEDKEVIRYQIKEARKLEKIIKQHQKKKYAHSEAYLDTIRQLSWDLSDMENKTHSDLAQVYYEYFSIITSYIFDLFNTRELENPTKHIVQIDALLVKQLFKMSQLYISKLESYLK